MKSPFGRGNITLLKGTYNHHGYKPLTSVMGWSSKWLTIAMETAVAFQPRKVCPGVQVPEIQIDRVDPGSWLRGRGGNNWGTLRIPNGKIWGEPWGKWGESPPPLESSIRVLSWIFCFSEVEVLEISYPQKDQLIQITATSHDLNPKCSRGRELFQGNLGWWHIWFGQIHMVRVSMRPYVSPFPQNRRDVSSCSYTFQVS